MFMGQAGAFAIGLKLAFVAGLGGAALLYPAASALAADAASANAAVSAAAASPGTPTATSLPLASFARLPFVEQPQLSPDGKLVAGLFNVNGQQQLRVLSLFDAASPLKGVNVGDGLEINWLRWVGNTYVLAGVTALLPVEDGKRWYISRLLSLDLSTGKVTRLLWDMGGQNAADVLWLPRDGTSEIIVAAQDSIYQEEKFWPAAYRVDLATGKKRLIQRGRDDVTNWYADQQGRIRAGEAYNDFTTKSRLLYRGETDNGSFRTVSQASAHKREVLISPQLFLPGTDHALVEHEDDAGRNGIFEMDLNTMRDVRPLYVADAGVEIGTITSSADETSLAGVTTTSPTTPVVWLDPVLAKLQADFDKAVPGRRARIVSFSQDRQKMLVTIDRPDNPGSLYYYDTDGGTLQLVAHVNNDLKSQRLGPVKLIGYTARDGTRIEGVLTLPAGRPARNLPIVMMPHGGPWAHDTADYDYWAQFIASRGYAVLQPNFRGSTGYGAEFLAKGEGQLGLAMQDDITDGLKWAVAQGIADPARACIVGASYGGYATMWGLAKDAGLYRCGIAIAGVANLRREVNDFGNDLRARKYAEDWQRMTPDFAAVSPINAVDRITAPLLLIHGKKDVTVDVAQSRSMFAKMKGAGKNVQYVELPEADHYFTREQDRMTLLGAIETFLLKQNPPDPAPRP